MFKPENNLSRFKRALLSYTFLYSFIISIPLTIGLRYLVENNREQKEYKQVTFWYENLDEEMKYTKVFYDFLKEAQEQLENDYKTYFRYPEITRLDENIETNIIVTNNTPPDDYFRWEIEKTGEFMNVYYDYTQVTDFKTLQGSSSKEQLENREREKIQSRQDKVFQVFTHLMQQEISNSLEQDNQSDGVYNLQDFSKVVIDYLTDNQGYSTLIPDLKINNIYLLKKSTGFFISYPLNNRGFPREIDYETRPWYRATEGNYLSVFSKKNEEKKSGLTSVYIDLKDQIEPNAIRTLWYKFKDTTSNEEYILCFDLFFDKSSQISSKSNLTMLRETLLSVDVWKFLLPLSLLLAVCLSLIYEFIIKYIFIRISKSHSNDFSRINIKREKKHYASKDENEIRFTIVGETKDINQSEQSREAGWSFNIQNIQGGIRDIQRHATEQEATSRYEFTNSYNLNMSHKKPQYRCIETWKVVSESLLGKTQNIGFFVAKWNTSNSADIEDGVDIQSIYWEKGYEEYLGTFKEQLYNHLLISDAQELVAVLDCNYSRQQNISNVVSGINSIKKTIESSRYLQQGKIIFSDFEALTDLYKKGKVKAICTLHFLKKLWDRKKLKDFFQTSVSERYLIEYKQGEFQDFYNSLDNETKKALLNKSPFKIMVYQENIDNIVSAQDDFCIISISNTPKLVAYTFTDNKFSSTGGIGWISWREVDIKFYDELYRCQLDKNHRIEDITTYLN